MKRTVRKILTVILSIGLVVGLAGGLWSTLEQRKGAAAYEDAASMAGLTRLQQMEPGEETPETPEDAAEPLLDLAALRQVNPDVVGWILIPGTELSYPLVQGTDNDYYLNHTWQKDRNSVGSIFLEYRVAADFSDYHTVIYGHRMRNGSMFGGLKHYQDPAYREAHPSVYVVTDSGVLQYDIFAAYEIAEETAELSLGLSDDAARQAFLEFALRQSVLETGLVPDVSEPILTLMTCTGRGYSTRWVVQAVLQNGDL